jgi:hypothetical protein
MNYHNAQTKDRPQISPCEINGGKSGNGAGFSPSTSAFPYPYDSANASYSCSLTWCSYQKDNRAKAENLHTKLLGMFGRMG